MKIETPAMPAAMGVLPSAWRAVRPALIAIAVFSVIINVLALTPTLYMMQVYDRAIASGHIATLVMLSLIALGGLAAMAVFDWLRGRLQVRVSRAFDAVVAPAMADRLIAREVQPGTDRGAGMRQLDVFRQVMTSPVATACFDLPLVPLYLAVAFLLHWTLGVLAIVSAGVLLVLAVAAKRAAQQPRAHAQGQMESAHSAFAQLTGHADDLRAMGLAPGLLARYLARRDRGQQSEAQAAFVAGRFGGATRFLRMVVQSAALGLGGLLAIQGQISGGAVIAASLILGRVLAPIDQIVGGWLSLGAARDAYAYLTKLLVDEDPPVLTKMPAMQGAIQVERLAVLAPGTHRLAIANISFDIAPGEQIGVVGLSGAGKSTLLRTLASALPVVRGTIRFDGLALRNWPAERLHRMIGYLPQSAAMFPGTVKENIARFDHRADAQGNGEIDTAAIAAAQRAGVHEMILRLPEGYDTLLGPAGISLSAGQAQQVALARALYGNPRILILDEPSAHLDSEGCYKLMRLLSSLRGERVTVVLSSHSGELLASLDKLLVLKAGAMSSFAPPPDGRLRIRNPDASEVTR